MKITIKDGDYEFSCEYKDERPNVEDVVFSACYLISRLYPVQRVKEAIHSVLKDI